MRNGLCLFISLILLFNIGYGEEVEFLTYEDLHGKKEFVDEVESPQETDWPSLEEISKMSYSSYCNLTVEQLEKGLLYDLSPLAETYLSAEKEFNVNAVLKAAQDALESNWGRDCFKNNNISGFFTSAEFWSKEDCIYYTSSKLEQWYIQPPHENCNHFNCEIGKFYNGRTIYDVSIMYCPSENGKENVEYADMVCQIAYEIYKRALTK